MVKIDQLNYAGGSPWLTCFGTER